MVLTTRRLFTALLFISLFVMASREIADPDFWWHLRTGQYILETGAIPHSDVFSFTNAGKPWIAHEWLSEVLIYSLYRIGSFPLLILTFAAITTLAFTLVYLRCEGKPYAAAFAVLLAAFTSAPTWGVRPQVISLLLTSLFLWVLEHNRRGTEAGNHPTPALWLLPPIMLLWVNLHSGFALGIVVLGMYLIGEFAETPNLKSLVDGKSVLSRLVILMVLCLAVIPLNPNGMAMYSYPFETLGSRAMQAYIQEWFSPDFHALEWQPFAWLIFGTMAVVGLSGKRVRLSEILLFAGLGYAGLRSARLIPLFALVAAPIMAAHLWHILESRGWTKWLQSSPRATRASSVLNGFLLALVLLGAGARVGMILANQTEIERAKFPAAAADFLQTRQNTGPLYNAYGWGGYLIWRLYPKQRVFVDGRADVYGDAFLEEFLHTWRVDKEWRAALDRFQVRTVLVETEAPLASALARDPAWQETFRDRQSVIFEKQ